MTRILFYSPKEAYGSLSNFALFAVYLKGRIWPTSEHYFQAQKFAGSVLEETIRRAATPGEAFRLGRSICEPRLRDDWEQVKDGVMRIAIRAKFTQHPDLTEALLATGEAELVEHTTRDAYWADGGDGHGLNRLGQILMEFRAALLDGSAFDAPVLKDKFEVTRTGYTISTDPAKLDVPAIHAFLNERSYWAQGRTLEMVERSITHSLCFGAYEGTQQVGFVRVVTDFATFAWVCDVFVLETQRGKGLGKWLIETVVAHPQLQRLRRLLLATRDAHGLYQDYGGFEPLAAPEKWMERVNKG
jgi:hypothetical protein